MAPGTQPLTSLRGKLSSSCYIIQHIKLDDWHIDATDKYYLWYNPLLQWIIHWSFGMRKRLREESSDALDISKTTLKTVNDEYLTRCSMSELRIAIIGSGVAGQ